MSKKVLFVATVVKKHICQFHIPYLKWFKEQGFEVYVCAKNDYENKSECVIPYCDKFIEIDFSRSPMKLSNILAFRKLKDIISQNHFDLIHCHTPVAAAITRLAAKDARKKGTVVMYTTHGFHFYDGAPKSSRLYYLAEKGLIKYTDGIITINKEDYEAAKKFCDTYTCKAFYVHGMGVDTKKFADTYISKSELKNRFGIPEHAKVLLSVSEINRNKNLETTLKAFADIKDENLYYLICGSGDLADYCHQLAEELGISDRVVFAGYRYDIFEVVHIADVFLFPSLREGLGVAPIEAMSAGVPIIASDIRGVREYAENMQNSILLKSTDISGFTEAIKLLINDEIFRLRLGENAALSVAPFDIENSVSAMADIYCSYLRIEEKSVVTV